MKSLKVPNRIFVIGVNAAGYWLPRVDAFFTLDPSPRNRWIMRHQRKGVQYYAAVPANYGTPRAHPHHRPPKERGVVFMRRVSGNGPMGSAPGMNPDPGKINTGNSAWGALGLAHHFGARKIGLIGVDGNREVRVSGSRPQSLDHLPWLFSTYDGPAEVRNGAPGSAVTCFPKYTIHEVIEWLSR
jgi:hypothetical protein